MAYLVIPKPGSRLGPCAEPCQHLDCGESRTDAARECAICQKPIGYETKFCIHAPGAFAHFACELERAEAKARTP